MSVGRNTIIILGDGGCGKTAFINKLFNNRFERRYFSTYGSIFYSFSNQDTKYNIIDTAGQETTKDYSSLYATAGLVVLMYDMNSRLSIKNALSKLEEIRNTNKDLRICIVGNKSDGKYIRRTEIDNLDSNYKDIHVEISCKTGMNINKALKLIL